MLNSMVLSAHEIYMDKRFEILILLFHVLYILAYMYHNTNFSCIFSNHFRVYNLRGNYFHVDLFTALFSQAAVHAWILIFGSCSPAKESV
jgi:hypothetical protein